MNDAPLCTTSSLSEDGLQAAAASTISIVGHGGSATEEMRSSHHTLRN